MEVPLFIGRARVHAGVEGARLDLCCSLTAPALPGTKGPWKADVVPRAATKALEASMLCLLGRVICSGTKIRCTQTITLATTRLSTEGKFENDAAAVCRTRRGTPGLRRVEVPNIKPGGCPPGVEVGVPFPFTA